MKKKVGTQKDLKRRMWVKQYEEKRVILKTIQNNMSLSTENRFSALLLLSKLKAKGSPVQVRNRCVLTGRSRGVHKYFKISRIMIRELAAKGLPVGLKKNSW